MLPSSCFTCSRKVSLNVYQKSCSSVEQGFLQCLYCRSVCRFRQQNTYIATVKPVLSGHSKVDKTRVFKTNGSLMQVESNTLTYTER